jgi:hypothetical protein
MVIQNKKGQDLSIGTLILIVLGIVVLVLLILGFSLGWDNLWEKINIFGGGSSIGNKVSACQVKVTSNDKYGYCNEFTLVTNAEGDKEYLNCLDSRIAGSLQEKISCDKTEQQLINEQCARLNEGDDTKVNNKDCPKTRKCFGDVSNTDCSSFSQEECESLTDSGCSLVEVNNEEDETTEFECQGKITDCSEIDNENVCQAVGCTYGIPTN